MLKKQFLNKCQRNKSKKEKKRNKNSYSKRLSKELNNYIILNKINKRKSEKIKFKKIHLNFIITTSKILPNLVMFP